MFEDLVTIIEKRDDAMFPIVIHGYRFLIDRHGCFVHPDIFVAIARGQVVDTSRYSDKNVITTEAKDLTPSKQSGATSTT